MTRQEEMISVYIKDLQDKLESCREVVHDFTETPNSNMNWNQIAQIATQADQLQCELKGVNHLRCIIDHNKEN